MDEQKTLPAVVRDGLARWAERSGCRLMVVFGSTVEGAGPVLGGDVDLALLFPNLPGPEDRLAIIGQLQDLVHPRRADVVFLRPTTDPVLRFEIFRSGVPIHEARAGLFVDEVVRALALYEDARPFRAALREKLVRGGAPG